MSQRSRLVITFILEAIAIVYFIAFLVSFDSAISLLAGNADAEVPNLLRSAWQWIGIAGFSHLAAALLRLLGDREALGRKAQSSTAHYPEQPTQ